MTEDPDFRRDKSDTVEGRGNAAARWDSYHFNVDDDVLAEAFPSPSPRVEDYDELVRDDFAADAVEESELIGFWVAWHLAGGFRRPGIRRLAPGHHLPQGASVPVSLRRPPRRVHLPLGHPRPREGLGRRHRQPHRDQPPPRVPTLISMPRTAPPSDELVANSPVAPLCQLASGIDALYLSGRAGLPKGFVARLEDCRSWAGEARRPAPCEIGQLVFGIAPHGWGKYRFCLDHEMARIGFSISRHLPTVRIQPRSEFLHAIGPEEAVAALHEVLDPELRHLRLWVNRVDLFADWQDWDLTLDDAHRFVCRADARRTYEVAVALTGFVFGSRTTKTFMARLNDKTADLAAKDNGWWFDVWGERYVPGPPVHRLEFEIGRQGLVEFDLNTPEQVIAAAGDLWAYATTEWLTYRSPTADQTRSRWPLAPEWLHVQQAMLGNDAVGIERLRISRRAASVEKLLPGLTGYLASRGALIGTRDIDDTVRAVGHHLHTYEIVSRTPFAERVARRRSELELR